jgi:predicted secreted hydrolase
MRMEVATVRRLMAVVAIAAVVVLGVWWSTRPLPGEQQDVSISWATEPTPVFARALAPRPFVYPADLGPHPEFQTEWWYYTGNLETKDGRHLGYQLTFFRRGLSPDPIDRSGSLAAREIYFAHFAVTDVTSGTHFAVERFSRQAEGLAGAEGEPYRVWLENWQVLSPDREGRFLQLSAQSDGNSLTLQLDSQKPYVPNGDHGLSAKGPEPGNASYYLSGTHLLTQGRLTIVGETFDVTGLSWFDHEWSTSALNPESVGWDWFSLQLSDGRDLMLFQIRNQDGSLSQASSGTLVEPDGGVVHLTRDQVTITVEDTWRSPDSGADYPAAWRIEIPSQAIALQGVPWLADQEMRVSVTYWEGAVRFNGTSLGAAVSGNGYIELTGYAGSLGGAF